MSIYYADESVTLYHGDCREVLPLIDSAHHVITDPPYSEHVHGAARSSRMQSANDRGGKFGADVRRNIDLGFTHLTPAVREFCAEQFARIAFRWVLVFSDTESSHLWRDDLESAGLDYVRTGAWVKLGSTPQFSGDRPATGFEAITIAHPTGRKRWNGGGKHALWTHPIVLDRGRNGARLHTTQKPLSLMGELVGLFTDEGETILDPFAGSGTTLVAAKQAGREAIGVELEERYCEVIAKRLAQGVLDFGSAS
jgi:site-specific DNA-methyltransferase (adenine-specific)